MSHQPRRPRTPQHWPKMKHRAAGREIRDVARAIESSGLLVELGRVVTAAIEVLVAPFRDLAAAVRDAFVAAPAPVWHLPIVPPIVLPDPDCMAGKHGNCPGQGWDDAADAPAPCPCACHTIAERVYRPYFDTTAALAASAPTEQENTP